MSSAARDLAAAQELPDLATPPEAAIYLRASEGTLRNWRSLRKGPIYIKSGGRVLYPWPELFAWLRPIDTAS